MIITDTELTEKMFNMNNTSFISVYESGLKKNCLTWVGPKEKCDVCGEEYSMIWMMIMGKKIVCKSCRDKPLIKELKNRPHGIFAELMNCECCFFDFHLDDLIIEDDQFFCPQCYNTLHPTK